MCEKEGDFCEEGIRNNNEDGGNDHSLSGGATDTLRTTADVEALVATDGSEDETEDDGLGETLHDVGKLEDFDGALPKGEGIQAKREDAGDHAAEESDEDGDGGEKRDGDERGENAGSDEFAAWVRAHSAHGVNLFGDEHGAEFGGNAGGAASGDKETGDGRAKLADESDGNDVACKRGLAKAFELSAGLQNHDGADKEAGEKNDGKRANTDVVHLVEGVLTIAWFGSQVGKSVEGEFGVVLNLEDSVFGNVLQYIHDGRGVGSVGVLMGNRKGCLSHLVLVGSSEESVTGENRSVKGISAASETKKRGRVQRKS